MNYNLFELNVFGDERGSLVSLEGSINIPFNIKRVYYIYDTMPNVSRGKHAHTKLEQVIVCMKGSCKFLLDDGNEKTIIELTKPSQGLYIGKSIWREMFDFSNDCVLMVLANDYFEENEYIRNYDDFLKATQGKF